LFLKGPMFRTEHITKEWKEAGAFQAQINLHGFWDEHTFLTKSGDLGCALKVGGIDYESLDHAGRDYAVKRLEAAFRSLDDRTRLYQVFFKRNRPKIPHEQYGNALTSESVEKRMAFLREKSGRLYSFEIFWVLMIDGKYAKNGLLRAISQTLKSPQSGFKEMKSLFASNDQRSMVYEQIERDCSTLHQKAKSLSGQLSDLTPVELLEAEKTFRLVRRLVNFCPSKIEDVGLHGPQRLDWQVCDSELEAHRGFLRVDHYYVRVLTLKELPGETRPLLLNGLLDIRANFHVVTEWHPVDAARARKEIASRRRHYHNSKSSFVSNLQDRQNTGPKDELVDDSKEAAVAELGSALTAIGMEGKSFGEFTYTVVVYDEDRTKVEHAIAEFQKLFTTNDGLLYEERYNLLNAFFATIPGNRHFNLRKLWALNSNYADLSFLFSVSEGLRRNAYLEREYLAVLETSHGTPYYLNLHSGDVGHTLVLGATGSGKSFTLNFTLQSLQKYDPLTFIFDLGASYESLTRAFGGSYLNVGLKTPGFTINPFSLEPTPENMNFLYLFLRVLIEAQGRYELTSADERALFSAIERHYKLPPEIRTLTNFASILGPLGERLHRWTRAGQFGHIFDIHSNLNLITDKGSVYSFTLDDQESAEPDLKVIIEPSDASALAAANGPARLVPAAEVDAARAQVQLAQSRAVAAVDEFRAEYPTKALKFDYTFRNDKPFDVSAIYHDDRFTYIKSGASEKFAIYETTDSKPDLVTFQLRDSTYVLPKIVDKGYLEIGKHRLEFTRKAE
jgi:type IV secretory pathway VirB4 component